MRRLTGLLIIHLAVVAAGCAWTPEERAKFRDDVARETTALVLEKLKTDVAPKIKEKVAEVISSIVDKLNVGDELKTKIRETSISAVNDGIDHLISGEVIGAKLEETLKDILDKVLPEGDPDSGGAARLIGGILSGLVLGGLGLVKPGG